MAFKRAEPILSKEIKRIAQDEVERINNRPGMSPVYLIILIILIILGINISYETYDNMEKEFTITDSESRNCLVEFQAKHCDPIQMNGECREIFECVQKDKNADLSVKTISLFDFLSAEIIENSTIPVVIIVMLLIYQLTRNIDKLRLNN